MLLLYYIYLYKKNIFESVRQIMVQIALAFSLARAYQRAYPTPITKNETRGGCKNHKVDLLFHWIAQCACLKRFYAYAINTKVL